MFKRIFVEEDILTHPRTRHILSRYPKTEVKSISRIEDVFGRVKKPYLQKRDDLNLFIGKKRGEVIKEAPDAYGLNNGPHYYFVHAYNCIYECEYCYLQGHFHSPDMVFFINHEEIASGIKDLSQRHDNLWFHAGEFSDSLALSHITGEIPFYFELFKELPQAKLEFRTKSANVKELLKCEPLPNVITSFSLSPEERIKKTDLKTPPLRNRLAAIKKLYQAGHPIGIHLDPIIYEENFIETYSKLVDQLLEIIPAHDILYVSLGVLRFPKGIYRQVQRNYPASDLLAQEFVKAKDGKVRYPRPMRLWMLGKVKDVLVSRGVQFQKIYLCME